MFNIDVKACILEHKRFLAEWISPDDVYYTSIHADYNPAESSMYSMGRLITQYLTKEKIVHYHNMGTLAPALAKLLTIATKLTTLELDIDRRYYVTYSSHRELTNSFNKPYQIRIDLDNGITYQK